MDSDGGVGQRCVGPRRAQEGRSVKRLVLVARGTNPWCGVCRFTAPPPGHRRSAGPRMSPVRCGLAAAAAAAAARSRARARSLSQPTPMLQTVPPPSSPGTSPEGTQPDEATDGPLFLWSCVAQVVPAPTDPVLMSPVSRADRRRVGRLRACTDGVRRVDREGGPSRSQAARSSLWPGVGRGIERGRFRFHRL